MSNKAAAITKFNYSNINMTDMSDRKNLVTRLRENMRSRQEYRRTDEYRNIRIANLCFFFCIIFEVAGIFTMPFFGTLGAQMAIYFMTFIFAFFMARKNKNTLKIPYKGTNIQDIIVTVAMTVCGISVAMLLNALAGLMSKAGAESTDDITKYPVILAVLCFAVVPAIVEEYVFRGVILGAFLNVKSKYTVMAGVLLSSLYFALLHFSLGSVLYGFFFGLIFALVRVATDNLINTICMHMAFNTINVLLSYVDMSHVPGVAIVTTMIALAIGFVIIAIIFFREKRIYEKCSYSGKMKDRKPWKLITKEGYVTMGICLAVMGMLLMM